VLWLGILFAGFGLVSANYRTAIATLFVCALSVSGALFLIEDTARPLESFMQTSHETARIALSHLGQIVQRSPQPPCRTNRIGIFRFRILFFQTLCQRSLVKRGEIRATLF
jgi:hypothetical protein